jgi:hypothetical protein
MNLGINIKETVETLQTVRRNKNYVLSSLIEVVEDAWGRPNQMISPSTKGKGAASDMKTMAIYLAHHIGYNVRDISSGFNTKMDAVYYRLHQHEKKMNNPKYKSTWEKVLSELVEL